MVIVHEDVEILVVKEIGMDIKEMIEDVIKIEIIDMFVVIIVLVQQWNNI